MQNTELSTNHDRPKQKSVRLHYLDWLRVLAILGVFLFHAVHPFDVTDWHIKNAEQSLVVTLVFVIFLYPWGMPLFFLLSGVGSWFALRKRTWRQFARERFMRLFVPFLVGSILFQPLQVFLEWSHETQKGMVEGSLLSFAVGRGDGYQPGFSPTMFGWLGYHLWFLGFLFAYSLIALPLFQWLKKEKGQRFINWLAGFAERRGGLLVFLLPSFLVQILLRPYFVGEHDWADFAFTLIFFIAGYILYADERFLHAVKRDRFVHLAIGIASTLFFFAIGAAGVAMDWAVAVGTPQFFLLWIVFSVNSWCWTLFVLNVGMRSLDFTNKWLQYGQQMIMPFFMVHQPVIVAIAFFVVQWNLGIFPKLVIVVVCSFLISIAFYELIVHRIKPLRVLFGVKASR
ncbi:MAG: acyltransferase family protein [Anaerolineales bacterium]|nr:acyltransferase family protein [Anaerolineales bacterium]